MRRWCGGILKRSPLVNAAINGKEDAVILLIKHGANTKNVLHHINNLSLSMIRLLLDHGANVYIEPYYNCYDIEKLLLLLKYSASDAHLFAYSIRWDIMELFNILCSRMKGHIDKYRRPDGRTLLHWAIRYNRRDMIKIMIETYKANVNTRDRNGNTPMHTVAVNSIWLIRDMIDYGARPRKNKKGEYPSDMVEDKRLILEIGFLREWERSGSLS